MYLNYQNKLLFFSVVCVLFIFTVIVTILSVLTLATFRTKRKRQIDRQLCQQAKSRSCIICMEVYCNMQSISLLILKILAYVLGLFYLYNTVNLKWRSFSISLNSLDPFSLCLNLAIIFLFSPYFLTVLSILELLTNRKAHFLSTCHSDQLPKYI